jgi:Mn-dependent DtxR family transcriptional regulator
LEAGVTRSTIAAMIIRGLIQRDPLGRLSLTKQGRDTLDALMRVVVLLVG